MQGASFVAVVFEEIVDMVVPCSHSVESCFCGGGAEFLLVMEMYSVWIKAIETSAG